MAPSKAMSYPGSQRNLSAVASSKDRLALRQQAAIEKHYARLGRAQPTAPSHPNPVGR
ncbi:hypothetical protein ACRALDRAFT_2036033, partial [Sodiomyces alcalophilus JCM 7366]|uniref:uncharacterized protein n=1 Tax=Sodiomyces alcalophilus JCM 7366 TaxID=591952 RepID=UPI0039B3E254